MGASRPSPFSYYVAALTVVVTIAAVEAPAVVAVVGAPTANHLAAASQEVLCRRSRSCFWGAGLSRLCSGHPAGGTGSFLSLFLKCPSIIRKTSRSFVIVALIVVYLLEDGWVCGFRFFPGYDVKRCPAEPHDQHGPQSFDASERDKRDIRDPRPNLAKKNPK